VPLTRHELWYGRDEPPVESRPLNAGRVAADLVDGDLRYVRAGRVELLRRLYVAVRDHNWKTIPAEISNREVEDRGERFVVRFEVVSRGGEIDLRWRGAIEGSPDGTITAEMNGIAERAFRYNRIGFCLLHGPNSAGRPYRARTPDGEINGELPLLVGARETRDGRSCPLFPSYEELEIDLEQGASTRFVFEGDLFEMEDQRNWTDASFKTYSTPLRLGFPHRARRGQTFHQRVTASFVVPEVVSAAHGSTDQHVRLLLAESLPVHLPRLGLGAASHGRPLSVREIAVLQAVRPDHVRADVHLGSAASRTELERVARDASALGAEVELAVFVTDDAERELAGLASVLPVSGARLARILVFHEHEPSTAARWLHLARGCFEPILGAVPLAGGTNAYFCQVNQERPDADAVDAIAYPITPQVHAFDEASIVESAQMQAQTVRTALSFSSGRPVVVTPVTLLPRFNPSATQPEADVTPGALPPEVDLRQMSLFAAAWTVASVKYLAEGGAQSVTYYETTGWRGVIETDEGPTLSERFPSRAGMAFPVYHVLADLGEAKGAAMLSLRSSAPLSVDGLALRTADGLRLLITCLVPAPQRVEIGPLASANAALRRLNDVTAHVALFNPELFRSRAPERYAVRNGQLELELAPFEVIRVDLRAI
jgi:hypothetical protein